MEEAGRALTETEGHDLVPGEYVFVEPGEKHGFENTGTAPFRFICVVPNPD